MTAEFSLAVHALVYLFHKQRVVSSAELAENICTNPARVRKVMAKLHRAGLVEACRGKGSGYAAVPEAGELSLSEIMAVLEEKPVEMNWRSGDVDMDCLVSSGMGKIMDGIYGRMNEACLKELSSVTVESVNKMIFGGKTE